MLVPVSLDDLSVAAAETKRPSGAAAGETTHRSGAVAAERTRRSSAAAAETTHPPRPPKTPQHTRPSRREEGTYALATPRVLTKSSLTYGSTGAAHLPAPF